MKNSEAICIIGGFDPISFSLFSKISNVRNNSIFINLNEKQINKKNIFNFKVSNLKKIFETLNKYNIENIVFLGKIDRPNLDSFKADGVVDKYLPLLFDSFKKGDGNILKSVIKIFTLNGYKVHSPRDISSNFFFDKHELSRTYSNVDRLDSKKAVKILNDLSKHDNAQSIICVNNYILSIEAAEGTDMMLNRSIAIRKKLGQLKIKCGLLVKVPKKNQSRLIDLPVIGLKTIKLVKKVNLNGIAINGKYTMVDNKKKFLEFANQNKLKIYDIS